MEIRLEMKFSYVLSMCTALGSITAPPPKTTGYYGGVKHLALRKAAAQSGETRKGDVTHVPRELHCSRQLPLDSLSSLVSCIVWNLGIKGEGSRDFIV